MSYSIGHREGATRPWESRKFTIGLTTAITRRHFSLNDMQIWMAYRRWRSNRGAAELLFGKPLPEALQSPAWHPSLASE